MTALIPLQSVRCRLIRKKKNWPRFTNSHTEQERERQGDTAPDCVSLKYNSFKKYKRPRAPQRSVQCSQSSAEGLCSRENREIKKCLSKTARLKGDLAVVKRITRTEGAEVSGDVSGFRDELHQRDMT